MPGTVRGILIVIALGEGKCMKKGGVVMAGSAKFIHKVVIDAPEHPVVRSRWIDERTVVIDFRAIRLPLKQGMTDNPGRRPLFLSVEDLKAKCEAYFESCMGYIFNKNGEIVMGESGRPVKVQVRPYTVSGFARALGLSTVTMLEYRGGAIDSILDEMRCDTDDILTFSRVLNDARQRIEEYVESRLYDRDGQGGARHVLDCAYGAKWVTSKERAEIDRMSREMKLRLEEFNMKKKLLEDSDGDDSITINVVRASKQDE